jgi:hypothetical protein
MGYAGISSGNLLSVPRFRLFVNSTHSLWCFKFSFRAYSRVPSNGRQAPIRRLCPSVIQTQSQSDAEFLAAANEIRESGSHPASDQDLKRKSAVWDALSQVLLRWRQLLWQLMRATFVSQTDLLFAPVFGWALLWSRLTCSTRSPRERCYASPTAAFPMRSNAPAVRKAGPTTSTDWSKLQPDATQA